MLPSSGYFKSIICPFYASGLCERPHCHFRHAKRDFSGRQGTALDPTTLLSSSAEDQSKLLQYVNDALQRVQQDMVEVSRLGSTTSQVAYVPTPMAKCPTRYPTRSPAPMAEQKRYIPAQSVPQYCPTPLSELRRRRAPDQAHRVSPPPKKLRQELAPDPVVPPRVPPIVSDADQKLEVDEDNDDERGAGASDIALVPEEEEAIIKMKNKRAPRADPVSLSPPEAAPGDVLEVKVDQPNDDIINGMQEPPAEKEESSTSLPTSKEEIAAAVESAETEKTSSKTEGHTPLESGIKEKGKSKHSSSRRSSHSSSKSSRHSSSRGSTRSSSRKNDSTKGKKSSDAKTSSSEKSRGESKSLDKTSMEKTAGSEKTLPDGTDSDKLTNSDESHREKASSSKSHSDKAHSGNTCSDKSHSRKTHSSKSLSTKSLSTKLHLHETTSSDKTQSEKNDSSKTSSEETPSGKLHSDKVLVDKLSPGKASPERTHSDKEHSGKMGLEKGTKHEKSRNGDSSSSKRHKSSSRSSSKHHKSSHGKNSSSSRHSHSSHRSSSHKSSTRKEKQHSSSSSKKKDPPKDEGKSSNGEKNGSTAQTTASEGQHPAGNSKHTESADDGSDTKFGLEFDWDTDDEDDDTYQECLRIFNEVQPTDALPPSTFQKQQQKKDTESLGDPVLPSRKRVAHDPDLARRSEPPKGLLHHVSAAQAMHNRFAQLQQRYQNQTVSNGHKSGAFVSSVMQAQEGSRKRIAHVPNAPLLAAARKTAASTSAGFVVASQPKGQRRMAHVPTVVLSKRPVIPAEYGSKVPTVVRQRYLNLFLDECIKTCTTEEQATEKALGEEKQTYERSANKSVYLNVAVNTLQRLRREATRGETSVPTLPVAPAAPAAPANCETRLELRVPGNKVVSHEMLLQGARAARTSFSIEKNRYKKPTCQLTVSRLYALLEPYHLTPELLLENGYPQPHPSEPGRALFGNTDARKYSKIGDPVLHCSRCGSSFALTEEGKYLREEECVYHWGRLWKRRIAGNLESRYSCCQEDSQTDGCCVGKGHVHEGYDPSTLTGFVRTLAKSPTPDGTHGVYALDCEMCYTTEGMELTRVTVVGWDLIPVYESLVKPTNPVLDYNTRFSGITEEDMEGVQTTIRDVQAVLLSLFSDRTVLLGHSLDSDLKALR